MFASDKDTGKVFSYGHAAMAVLRRSMHQSLMASCHVTFEAIRKHHAKYTEGATDKASCLQFLKLWAHSGSFIETLVLLEPFSGRRRRAKALITESRNPRGSFLRGFLGLHQGCLPEKTHAGNDSVKHSSV